MNTTLLVIGMIAILLAALVFVIGYANPPERLTPIPDYVQMCLNSCNNTKNAGDTSALELGPCLLDPIPNEPDWVCDVAHSPRTGVDNNPHNQCQDYLTGKAHHFVEVSPECKLIRAV